MNFNWFKIFNLTEFSATGLVSRTYTVNLEGLGGESDILVTRGNVFGMLYKDTFFSLPLGGDFSYVLAPYAVFLDTATQDVYLGISAGAP